jgi:hypothetical protein
MGVFAGASSGNYLLNYKSQICFSRAYFHRFVVNRSSFPSFSMCESVSEVFFGFGTHQSIPASMFMT